MIYVGILNSLFLLRYGLSGNGRLRQQAYVLVLGGLFLFSAFRFEVGCDWTGYLNQYGIAQFYDLRTALSDPEPIWWAILTLQQRLGIPYAWINVATSLVFFTGVHALARRQPDPLGFLVVLFPFLVIAMIMSALRQGMAIGLICFALNAFMDRRRVALALWVLAAGALHSSALVFLFLIPLAAPRLTGRNVALSVLVAIPGALALLQTEGAQVGIDRYLDTGVEAFGAMFRLLALGLSGLFFLTILRRHWSRLSPRDYPLVTVGACLMVGAMSLLPISSVIGDRLGYYLLPIQAMIFARVPYLGLRNGAFFSVLPYAGLLLQFLVWTSTSDHFQLCFVPYQSWLLGGGGVDHAF